jgi:hypothetical protein
MDLLSAFKALVRVTETGSFSAVARERDLILLRHEFSSSSLCCDGSTARTSLQGFDDAPDQSDAHGCDRVGDVALRPRGRILWVDNRRVSEVP